LMLIDPVRKIKLRNNRNSASPTIQSTLASSNGGTPLLMSAQSSPPSHQKLALTIRNL
jgi:hypothetical protein